MKLNDVRVWVIALLVLFICIGLVVHIGRGSEGERVGNLVKIADRGWIWQTWEGEVLMGGETPYVYEFSVCDRNMTRVQQLQDSLGKKIIVKYQSPMITFDWIQKSNWCMIDFYVLEEKCSCKDNISGVVTLCPVTAPTD